MIGIAICNIYTMSETMYNNILDSNMIIVDASLPRAGGHSVGLQYGQVGHQLHGNWVV